LSMKPSLFWSMMVKASLNSWIWACSNMENTLELASAAFFFAFLGAWDTQGNGYYFEVMMNNNSVHTFQQSLHTLTLILNYLTVSWYTTVII
jgi:hypothetical protein